MIRRIFVHLHIPKCGGSTVVNYLSLNFGSALVNTNSILNDYQYDQEQVYQIIQNYPDAKCLTGHKLSLDLPFNQPDVKIVAFTWIRDPIERFISHYFYHRNHTELIPEAKEMDLREYSEWALAEGNQEMYINGQTKFLSKGSLQSIKSRVDRNQLCLFPLSKLQESIWTLNSEYPNDFLCLVVHNKNISHKDQIVSKDFYEFVKPYVEDDYVLLELANNTHLVNLRNKRLFFNFSHAVRGSRFNLAKILRRISDFFWKF